MTEKQIVNRLSIVGIVGNLLLVAFKLLAGVLGHSGAMISDAVHSLSDVLATFVAYLGVRTSETPPDRDHPYGHEQVENIATLVLGLILLGAGCSIGYVGLRSICAGNYDSLPIPTLAPLVAAVVSIVVKEAMFWYTRHYALILNSSAFMADAWHHRSDAFSSIGSLIGVAGAILGCPVLDPIASVVICLFILKIAFDVLRRSSRQMVDEACDDEFEKKIAETIRANRGVDRINILRTRKFGNRVFVEAEISVDGNKTLFVAHRIAHEAHNAVEANFPSVKHIMIHVNPTQLNDEDGVFHDRSHVVTSVGKDF